jgi:hypothetical protein
VLEREIRYLPLSDDDARTRILAKGISKFHADTLIEVNQAFRDGGADAVTSTLSDLTRHAPCSLQEFLVEHRSVFR